MQFTFSFKWYNTFFISHSAACADQSLFKLNYEICRPDPEAEKFGDVHSLSKGFPGEEMASYLSQLEQ